MRFSSLLRRSKPSSTKNKRHPGSKKGSVPLVCDDVICDPEEVAFTSSKLVYESATTKALLTSGSSNIGSSNIGSSNNGSSNNDSSKNRKRSLNCTKVPPHLMNHTYAKQWDSISDSAPDDDTCYACKMEELQRQALIKQDMEKQSLENQQSLKQLSEKLLSEKLLSESRLSTNQDSVLSDQESSGSHHLHEFSLPSIDIPKLEMVSLPPSLKKARIGESSECIKSLQPSSSSHQSLPQLQLNKDDSDTETEELEDDPGRNEELEDDPGRKEELEDDPDQNGRHQESSSSVIGGQSNQEEQSRPVLSGQNHDLTLYSLPPPPLSSIPPS